MKAKRYIYALLILMTMLIGREGVLSNMLYHCSMHDECSSHHHCNQIESAECESHDTMLQHSCLMGNKLMLEYVATSSIRINSLLTQLVVVLSDSTYNINAIYCQCNRLFDDNQGLNIYRECSLSTGLLRAPPVKA